MISPSEALRLILENTPTLESETVPLQNAIDRVLAEDIYAKDDLPPFDNSAMDGFAVRSQDLNSVSQENPTTLKVRDIVKAGALASTKIRQGEAIKIMTGAPIPIGADSVVMREMTKTNPTASLIAQNPFVEIFHAPQPGENIRSRAEDVKSGDLLLRKQTLARSYEVALLAAQGFMSVAVIKKPKVSVVATGDELLDVSQRLAPGYIRNSNGPALTALLSRWDILATDYGIIGDNKETMIKTFKEAIENSDVFLVSGGVSVGDFDFTRELLEQLGVTIVFHRVAIKPGKPLLFGTHRSKLVFGLPGNPVAALVCLEEFARPALEKLQGLTPRHPNYHLEGVLGNEYPKDPKRQQYLFCQARPATRLSDPGPIFDRQAGGRAGEESGKFVLHVIRPQGSSLLGMASQANALALAPIETSFLQKGTKLSFRWLK